MQILMVTDDLMVQTRSLMTLMMENTLIVMETVSPMPMTQIIKIPKQVQETVAPKVAANPKIMDKAKAKVKAKALHHNHRHPHHHPH